MEKTKHSKAVEIGMELFDAQQEFIGELSKVVRAQIKMEQALEGMTEEERAAVAADMVMGVKANNRSQR